MAEREARLDEAEWQRAGTIAAASFNAQPGKPRRARKPTDFYRRGNAGALHPTREEIAKLEHRKAPSRSIRR